jgi:hypothetical protein
MKGERHFAYYLTTIIFDNSHRFRALKQLINLSYFSFFIVIHKYIPPFAMPEEKTAQKKDESPMPKDSFIDDLLYVATETTNPLADPKKDPVPGERNK